jgi:AcrR family transcriptional regulator
MPTDDPAARTSPTAGSWRELAVARSLDSARTRAENRVQRFLDAALDLMETSPDKEFTVQEVVERSGQSLRSFYQYFAGKYELLLALFEEAVRTTADELRESVAEEDSTLDRLHRFVVDYYRMCRPAPKGRSAKKWPITGMADFAQRLLTEHPKEASSAFAPIASLFEELLDEAAADGFVRPDLRHARVAGVILQAIMFNSFALIISGSSARGADAAAEELWDLVVHGIGTAKVR